MLQLTRPLIHWLVGLLSVVLTVVAVVWKQQATSTGTPAPSTATEVDSVRLTPAVHSLCGSCHAVPKPDCFPKAAWYREVQRGYDFYFASGRTDLELPPQAAVTEYFRSQAPDTLAFYSDNTGVLDQSSFRPSPLRAGGSSEGGGGPSIAHVRWSSSSLVAPSSAGGSGSLLSCDMGSGMLSEYQFEAGTFRQVGAVALKNPSHVEATDLDQDGRRDFVVADLGSFLPEDHDRGQVTWITRSDTGKFGEPTELASGLGRVADAQAGDFDNDGVLDLVVAEFGWLTTGRILLLKGTGLESGIPRFKVQVIDTRHGAIHIQPADLNGDGHLDFVALLSQEHETVEAFMNDAAGSFKPHRIFEAGDPAFGSSGLQLVDFDLDGDKDVLLTNGDMYDSFELKPYHGIRWLENTGSGVHWNQHQLAIMPGVHRALAADVNGDGLLDVVACSLVPPRVMAQHPDLELDSLIWLEQVSPKQFVRHVLERNSCHHATLDVADFDNDGRPDLAVGNTSEATNEIAAPITIWWNETAERARRKN